MTLTEKLKKLYNTLTREDFRADGFNNGSIVLRNDSKAPPDGKVKVGNDYIDSWEHPTLAQPTQAQIDAITE
jgi:hypothetical protein|tara:strand:+ start:260 stop:475 length:216 start_codon:yes stop_codon:yes gene_type:complete